MEKTIGFLNSKFNIITKMVKEMKTKTSIPTTINREILAIQDIKRILMLQNMKSLRIICKLEWLIMLKSELTMNVTERGEFNRFQDI
jgi:hypothetical protein